MLLSQAFYATVALAARPPVEAGVKEFSVVGEVRPIVDAGVNEYSVVDEGNGIAGPARKMPSFSDFVKAHNREYALDSSEFTRRKALYEARVSAASTHNSNEDRLWTAHPNHHWDRDEKELKSLSGWLRMDLGGGLGHGPSSLLHRELGESKPDMIYKVDNLPAEHHWKSLSAMTPERILSQVCGNCWAAATTAMLNAHLELHQGEADARVSEARLTHCSGNPHQCGGSGGCGGSTPELALQYAMVNGDADLFGLAGAEEKSGVTEIDESNSKMKCPGGFKAIVDVNEKPPHEAISGIRTTPEGSLARKFGMIGWQRLPENQYEPLMWALVHHGPAAVAVSTDWSSGGLSQYSSGIYNGCQKDASISHSVLAIGYGSAKHKTTDEKALYWLLQNSWGQHFGENGHFRLLRSESNTDYCGTDSEPLLGLGCTGGESKVKVCGMCGVIYDTVFPLFEAKTERSKKMKSIRDSLQAESSVLRPAGTHINDVVSLIEQEADGNITRSTENELNRLRMRAKRQLQSESALQAS